MAESRCSQNHIVKARFYDYIYNNSKAGRLRVAIESRKYFENKKAMKSQAFKMNLEPQAAFFIAKYLLNPYEKAKLDSVLKENEIVVNKYEYNILTGITANPFLSSIYQGDLIFDFRCISLVKQDEQLFYELLEQAYDSSK